jgi:hypothetical protein
MPAESGTASGEVGEAARRQAHQPAVAHAVVAALELQDAVASAEGAGEAHGVHVRLGAGGHEAHLLRAGHRLHDGLGERDAVLVGGEEGEAAAELLAHRVQHLRVPVPQEHRPGAEQVVQVVAPRHVAHMRPEAFAQDHLRREVAEAAAGQDAAGALDEVGFVVHGRVSVGMRSEPGDRRAGKHPRLGGIPAPA